MYPLPTLKEFLDNPMGKGSTAIMNRQLIKDSLIKRYNTLKRNKEKKFDITVYKDGDEYYFHLIIPSESERTNTYDVVLHFNMDEETDLKYDNFLNRYYIKFFSNCPSFTYTFAQTFHQYGFSIDSLSNKFKDVVLDNEPIIRNPGQIVSFEKSLYFACLHIQESYILKNKMYINQLAKPFDAKVLNDNVRTTDTIEMEIKKTANVVKEKKKDNAPPKKEGLIKRTINAGKEKITGKTNINIITPKKKIGARRLGGNKIGK
jgi:hypothetical protein